jgi:hypothetical protein
MILTSTDGVAVASIPSTHESDCAAQSIIPYSRAREPDKDSCAALRFLQRPARRLLGRSAIRWIRQLVLPPSSRWKWVIAVIAASWYCTAE